MIILEGCDGTGKTTLAKRLAEDLGLAYAKKSVPDGDPFQDYLKTIGESKSDVVYDRLYMGEEVYPQVKPNRIPLSKGKKHMLERLINSKGGLVILCEATDEQIKHTFETRGEDFITFEEAKRVSLYYHNAQCLSIVNKKFFINPRAMDYDKFLKFIRVELGFARGMQDVSKVFLGTGLPLREDRVMLVGDKPSAKTLFDVDNRYAFTGYEGSSMFLSDCLAETLYPSRYYLTNVCKRGGERILETDLALLSEEINFFKNFRPGEKLRIVAMGSIATAALKKLSIQHEFTFHPQYWKRFKSQHRQQFIDFLNK